MPTTITGTDTSIPTSITIPSDGDLVNAASVAAGFGGLADRTAYLKAQTYGVDATDQLPIPLHALMNNNARFEFGTGAFPETGASASATWTQSSITDSGLLVFELSNLPKRGKITDIVVTLIGASGHVSLPAIANLPSIQLWRQDPGAASAPTRVATHNEGSATIAAYEVAHTIHITGLTEIFDNAAQNRYYLAIYGETNEGGDGVAGMQIIDAYAIIAPTV